MREGDALELEARVRAHRLRNWPMTNNFLNPRQVRVPAHSRVLLYRLEHGTPRLATELLHKMRASTAVEFNDLVTAAALRDALANLVCP